MGFLFTRREVQRGRVHAVAQAGGRRAVGKDMAQMRAAVSADGFGAAHAVGVIDFLGNRLAASRLRKAEIG